MTKWSSNLGPASTDFKVIPKALAFVGVAPGRASFWDSQQWEWVCLWLFDLLLVLFFPSCWVALTSAGMRDFALSYCISLCCVWLLSRGGLPFSEGKWRGSRWGDGGTGWDGRKKNCGQDILYERISIYNKKEWTHYILECVCMYVYTCITYMHAITTIEKRGHELEGEWRGAYEKIWPEERKRSNATLL